MRSRLTEGTEEACTRDFQRGRIRIYFMYNDDRGKPQIFAVQLSKPQLTPSQSLPPKKYFSLAQLVKWVGDDGVEGPDNGPVSTCTLLLRLVEEVRGAASRELREGEGRWEGR